MNAAVTIMQVVDWSKYSLEEWLYQFGAWMNNVSGTCGKSTNPIAVAMDEAAKKLKHKINDDIQKKIVADWICSDEDVPVPKLMRVKCACEISDNEARAVQRLILDMRGQSEIMDEWMDAIICRYFYENSWSQMCNENRTGVDAKFDVKCGLAALHCRYGFIAYEK